MVDAETDLRTPEQFEHIVLREADGYPVRLGDVGHAALGPERQARQRRFNGREAVALGVVKQATANPLDVSEAVRAELPAIQQDLPEGLRTDLAYATARSSSANRSMRCSRPSPRRSSWWCW